MRSSHRRGSGTHRAGDHATRASRPALERLTSPVGLSGTTGVVALGLAAALALGGPGQALSSDGTQASAFVKPGVLAAHQGPSVSRDSLSDQAVAGPDARVYLHPSAHDALPVAIGVHATATNAVAVTGRAPSRLPLRAYVAYQRAAQVIGEASSDCHLDWGLLAGIGDVASAHGRTGDHRLTRQVRVVPALVGSARQGYADSDGGRLDGDAKADRAIGPMQLMPSTWQVVKVDADGDGKRDPQDLNDAALATAVLLCGTGDDLSTRAGRLAALHAFDTGRGFASAVLASRHDYRANPPLGRPGALPAVTLYGAPGVPSTVPALTAPTGGTAPTTGGPGSSPTGGAGSTGGNAIHPARPEPSQPAPSSQPSTGPTSGPTTDPTTDPTDPTTDPTPTLPSDPPTSADPTDPVPSDEPTAVAPSDDPSDSPSASLEPGAGSDPSAAPASQQPR